MWRVARLIGLPGLVLAGCVFLFGLYLNYQDIRALGWSGGLWAFVGGIALVAFLIALELERRYGPTQRVDDSSRTPSGTQTENPREEQTRTVAQTDQYTPIKVIDENLGLFYRLAVPPSNWVDRDIRALQAHYVDDVLRGPYDAINNCAGHVETSVSGPGLGSFDIIPSECPTCDRDVGIDQYCETDYTIPRFPTRRAYSVVRMKRNVMLRLQQAHLNGVDIEEEPEISFRDISYTAVT